MSIVIRPEDIPPEESGNVSRETIPSVVITSEMVEPPPGESTPKTQWAKLAKSEFAFSIIGGILLGVGVAISPWLGGFGGLLFGYVVTGQLKKRELTSRRDFFIAVGLTLLGGLIVATVLLVLLFPSAGLIVIAVFTTVIGALIGVARYRQPVPRPVATAAMPTVLASPAPTFITVNVPPDPSLDKLFPVRASINDSANIETGGCPYCGGSFLPSEATTICPNCKTPHHRGCWGENGGCTTAHCPKNPKTK